MFDSLRPHGLQHARLPCPSPILGACSNQVSWVSDVIQPSHPLPSPSPHSLNLSQNQGLFQWVSSSHQVAKHWTFSFSISPSNENSGLTSFRIDWLGLLAAQGTLMSLLQHHSSKVSILQCSAFLYIPTLTSIHDYWKTKQNKTWLWIDWPLLARQCLCFLMCCLGSS